MTPNASRPSKDRRTRVNVRAHVSINEVSSPVSMEDWVSAALHVRLTVPALTASPMVTIRMIRKAATSFLERAVRAGDLKPHQSQLERKKNGAGTERVSSRANQTTRGVANVNNS
jgi:hypothetical protein